MSHRNRTRGAVLVMAIASLCVQAPSARAAAPVKGGVYHDGLSNVELAVSDSGRTLRVQMRCRGATWTSSRPVRIRRGRFSYTGPAARVSPRRRTTIRLSGVFTSRSAARGVAGVRGCRARFRAPASPASRPSSGGAARADYNGDGFTDLAIGAPWEGVGDVQGAGAVLVVYGGDAGLRTTGAQLLHLGVAGIPGPPKLWHRFGTSIAGGDFNLDGRADLAVTTIQPQSLYVMYGSPNGLGTSLPQVFTPDRLGLRQPEPGGPLSLVWGNFGRGPAADLAVGSCCPADTVNQDLGQVAVLYGSTAGGLGAQPPQVVSEENIPDFTYRRREHDRFGVAIAAGNVGRTAEHELIVGAPAYNSDAGAAFVFYGSSDGLLGPHQHLAGIGQYQGENPSPYDQGPQFGSALAVGDFDADGIGDVAAGAPGFNHFDSAAQRDHVDGGAIRIHRGTSTGASPTGSVLAQDKPEFDDQFGSSLAGGDFDGDGQRDLAVGAPGESLSAVENGGAAANYAGAVSVFYGTSSGLASSAKHFLVQGRDGVQGTAETADYFGESLTAWNWGRGPETDLAIGTPAEDVGTVQGAGVVQILYGSQSGGVGFGGQQLLDQSAFGLSIEQSDGFGGSFY